MMQTSLFPHSNFPVRLEFGEKKEKTICYFECDAHLQKYITRYKLDKRKIKVDYRDAESTQSDETNKNKVRQGTRKTSSRSATKSTRSTKKLDSNRNTNRTSKSKK